MHKPKSSPYPDWVVLNVPHDSRYIPPSAAPQFALKEVGLQREILRMTDHWTHELFRADWFTDQTVRAKVSRLVVDVERFVDDAQEPMSARGMGVIYTKTASQFPLRRELSGVERKELLDLYYYPHHARLESLVDETLSRCGRCLVIDCHSFPSRPLPYELDQGLDRPDICIGTDGFHTSKLLAEAFVEAFETAGFAVCMNSPFSGALVPVKHYQKDSRVEAVMVEVNRRLYMDEEKGAILPGFKSRAEQIASLCEQAAIRGAKGSSKGNPL